MGRSVGSTKKNTKINKRRDGPTSFESETLGREPRKTCAGSHEIDSREEYVKYVTQHISNIALFLTGSSIREE